MILILGISRNVLPFWNDGAMAVDSCFGFCLDVWDWVSTTSRKPLSGLTSSLPLSTALSPRDSFVCTAWSTLSSSLSVLVDVTADAWARIRAAKIVKFEPMLKKWGWRQLLAIWKLTLLDSSHCPAFEILSIEILSHFYIFSFIVLVWYFELFNRTFDSGMENPSCTCITLLYM